MRPCSWIGFVLAASAACSPSASKPAPVAAASPNASSSGAANVTAPASGEPPAKTSAGSAKGAKLTQLSSADPECALDDEGRPWRWPSGKLERVPGNNIQGAKQISCSRSHTCVVTQESTVSCWGDNTYGALGDGTQATPEGAVVAKDLKDIEEVDVDVSRTCARAKGGDVYCWGDREFAKAGDGTMIDGHKGREKPLPGKPVLGLTGATSLATSLIHACSSTGDGSVMCWGQCRSGACGLPPRPPWISRATKAPKVKEVAALSAGEDATCGIEKSGSVLCWGTSTFGILGESVSDAKPHDEASKIALPGPATEVAVGIGGHACARLQNGAIACWGHNDHGQLGDGSTTDRKTAVAVKGIEKATHVATGGATTCAIVESGRLYCWGQKRNFKNSASPEDTNVPVEINN